MWQLAIQFDIQTFLFEMLKSAGNIFRKGHCGTRRQGGKYDPSMDLLKHICY